MIQESPSGHSPVDLTPQRIKESFPPEPYRRGEELHADGCVVSATSSRGTVTAHVLVGTSTYTVRIPLGDRKRGIRCSCGRDDACEHIVAALLYVHQNLGDLAEAAVTDDRLPAGDIFGGVPTPKLTAFLRSEVKRDARLRLRFLVRFGGSGGMGRPDYRGIADDMFAKLVRPRRGVCGPVLADFFRAAKARQGEGRAEEAVRICQELSESVWANHRSLEDEGHNYWDTFTRAVEVMAAYMAKLGHGHALRRQHISYLHDRFVTGSSYGWREDYRKALLTVCTRKPDLEYWGELHERALPEAVPDDYEGKRRAVEMVLMQVDILERLGGGAPLEAIFRKYHSADPDICRAYIKYVAKSDPGRAAKVAEEAALLFPMYRRGFMYGAGVPHQ